MKDGLTPVTNQNVSGSVSNNLSKLEKEHYALQQYVRRNNVEILGLPDIFTGDRLTEKVVELCNDVGIVVEVRDIKPCHRLFQKESYNQLPNTTWKVSRVILSYSGPHFPSFRLNMERYSTSFRIQYRCGKMRNRTTPNTDTFYAVQKNYCKICQ